MEVCLTPGQAECAAAVRSSVLLPLMAREFGAVAFTELLSRQQYYRPLLQVLLALCAPASEQLLVSPLLGVEQQQQQPAVRSVADAVRGLIKGATLYRDRMAKVLQTQQQVASQPGARVDKQTGARAAGNMRHAAINHCCTTAVLPRRRRLPCA